MHSLHLENPAVEMNQAQIDSRKELAHFIENGSIRMTDVKQCPSCGFNQQDTIVHSDRHGIGVDAKLCHQCGLVFTSPALNEDSLKFFYEKIYAPLNGFASDSKHLFNPVQGENIYNYTLEFCMNLKRIVDIGCGAGDVVKFLAQKYPDSEVLGADFNQDFVNSYESGPNHKLIAGGIDDLIALNVKYDLIILSHVLEHVTDIESFVKKLQKICHKKTLLYIEVPGLFGFFRDSRFYDFNFSRFHTLAHNYNFTLSSLERFLKKCGLKMLKGDEFIRSIFEFSDDDQSKSPEYSKVKLFLEKTLPVWKDKFSNKIQEYTLSPLPKMGYPSKEIAFSQLIQSNRQLQNDLKRTKTELDYIKLHLFKYVVKRVKQYISFKKGNKE